jgi:hypothetical protein
MAKVQLRWRVTFQLMAIASSFLIVAATVFSTTRSTEFHLEFVTFGELAAFASAS